MVPNRSSKLYYLSRMMQNFVHLTVVTNCLIIMVHFEFCPAVPGVHQNGSIFIDCNIFSRDFHFCGKAAKLISHAKFQFIWTINQRGSGLSQLGESSSVKWVQNQIRGELPPNYQRPEPRYFIVQMNCNFACLIHLAPFP